MTTAPDGRLDDLAVDLTALAHPSRLRILKELIRPHYAGELAETLGTTRQAVQKHIDQLRQRGLVRVLQGRRATGPVVEYQVVPQRLFALAVALNELARLEPTGGPPVKARDLTLAAPPVEGAPPEPAPPETPHHLLLLDGPDAGSRCLLSPDRLRLTIGRDPDRDLCLQHDPYVSGRHAEIQQEPGGGHALVDAMAANGTFLNFVRLPRGERVLLKPGDVIRAGHTRLVYQAP